MVQAIYPMAAARSMKSTIEFKTQQRQFVLRCDTPEGRYLGVMARDDWFLKSLVMPTDSHFMNIFHDEAKNFAREVNSYYLYRQKQLFVYLIQFSG